MAVPMEVELKLAVTPRDLPRLRRRLERLGPARRMRLETIYYDTSDGLLAAHGFALRLRRVGARWIQTLKSESEAAALARRGEWEWPLRRARVERAHLTDTPVGPLLARRPRARLIEQFRTRFVRALWTVEKGGARVELALDDGEIRAGARVEAIRELELELKEGGTEVLPALALRFARAGRGRPLALLPYGDSKARRGRRLAQGEAPQPVKASAQQLFAGVHADTEVEVAVKLAVGRATEVLLANTHGVLADDDPEFVHQARVALRRVRSVLRLLRAHVEFPKRLAADLRWIARALGRARDWDVLAGEVLPAIGAALGPAYAVAIAPVLADAQRRRRRERDKVRAALASSRFACATLALLAWSAAPSPGTGPSLGALAARRLQRQHARLFEAARGFARHSADEQHRVRILAKRLRYALEFFAVALPAPATAAYVERLATLQDELGALNDTVVARARLRQLARSRPLRAAIDEWAMRVQRERTRAVEHRLARLRERTPPWR